MNSGGRVIPLVLGANATLQSAAQGDRFYVVASPGVIEIDAGDGFSAFYSGTGAYRPKGFTLLQIKNPANVAIVVQIWVGYSDYIDKRNIPLAPAQQGVIVSTNISIAEPGPGSDVVQIPDQSATFVQSEVDGLNYFLVQRLSINFLNSSNKAGTPQFVLINTGKSIPTMSTVTELASVYTVNNFSAYPYPILGTPGNFWILWEGGAGSFSVRIFEIYQGIPALT